MCRALEGIFIVSTAGEDFPMRINPAKPKPLVHIPITFQLVAMTTL